MSLAGRLLLFFLGTLAVILVAFSATMYGLGWYYLHHRMDERLEKTLGMLETAVHVEPDGLEWKPQERRIAIGLEGGPDQIRWSIHDPRGRLVGRSANWDAEPAPPPASAALTAERPSPHGHRTVLGNATGWRVARRRLLLAEMTYPSIPKRSDDEPEDDEYEELILTAALSPEPVDASVARLMLSLGAASASTWLLCAAAGRWLCRRALAPISSLAAAARAKAAADDQDGLPIPETKDELEDLGRAFNALLDRRREALERQSRFTGDASHQLRTPLTGLLSLVEVVRRRPRTTEEYEQTLDQVRHEAIRLNRIVESLLFLARAESEAEPLREEPIDLAVWVPDVLKAWEGRARSADLRFLCESPPGPVRAHSPLLAQAVENLVDNALKYSEAGSPVTVRLRREPGAAALSVEDRGCGLTEEERASVFEPFYQSPRARLLGRGGVGLGLSVVRRVVRASRGSIRVESIPGAGTCFTIRLPEAHDAA